MPRPTNSVTLTLSNVPSITYSVSCLSLLALKSPNLNTDLAANKKPSPANWSSNIKLSISTRSIMPMLCPANGKLPSLEKLAVSLSSIILINTALGLNIIKYPHTTHSTLGFVASALTYAIKLWLSVI